MKELISLAWFVCTIARSALSNWDICKEVGAYGIPTRRAAAPDVKADDRLVIYVGGLGYIAECRALGPVKVPKSAAQAPWPGGSYRFAYVVPMEVVFEVKKPVKLPFDGPRQVNTGVSKAQLQNSFSKITDEGGHFISQALADQRSLEALRQAAPAPSASQ